MPITGPWYISIKAAKDYLAIRRQPPSEDNIEMATIQLSALATFAKFVRIQPNGLSLYRIRSKSGANGYRFLVGKGEQEKPALISVLREHDK